MKPGPLPPDQGQAHDVTAYALARALIGWRRCGRGAGLLPAALIVGEPAAGGQVPAETCPLNGPTHDTTTLLRHPRRQPVGGVHFSVVAVAR